MASQYITFMIIFTLGLSMVIITNGMFTSLNEQFSENVADLELKEILKRIQLQIRQNTLIHPEEKQTILQQLEFPISIGQGFSYFIELSNTSDGRSVILKGRTFNDVISQEITFSLGSTYFISSSGEFTSTDSYLSLNLEKNENYITITIS
ncbi:MAG: hypothetical protein KAT16_01735 [Candidatus Heimdallarchaeota archaeon]|nr:hypothetical protein [Candidatus Heimdallarchaeota archaeon]